MGVIPCHNHEKWINDAINSLLEQTYPLSGIVVVDDGSQDQSFSVVEKRLDGIQRKSQDGVEYSHGTINKMQVLLVKLPKAYGPAFARNAGIQVCWNKANYFALLDSDDFYSAAKVEKSLEVFEKDSESIGVVYSDYYTFNEELNQSWYQHKEPFSRFRLLQECIVNCDSVINKKAFEKVGLFDPQLRTCEDMDLWLRISEHFVLCHIAEPLVAIKVGSHSSTSTVSKEDWNRNYRRMQEKLIERMNKK